MRSILAETDLSPSAQCAVRRAGVLATASSAGLTILHVVDDDQPPDVVAAEIRDAERVLAREAHAVGAAHDLVVIGAHVGADLLVLGTRGAGGLSRLPLGSVAEALLRTLQIGVLAVAAPTDRGAEGGGA